MKTNDISKEYLYQMTNALDINNTKIIFYKNILQMTYLVEKAKSLFIASRGKVALNVSYLAEFKFPLPKFGGSEFKTLKIEGSEIGH